MGAPYSKLRSKLDRALVAYLTAQGVANTVLPARSSSTLDVSNGPVVVVRSHSGRPEAAPAAGIWRFQVEIAVYGEAAPAPANADPDAQRFSLDDVFGATVDALMQSADLGQSLDATTAAVNAAGRALAQSSNATVAADNADMADFTLQFWIPTGLDAGNPKGDDQETVWKEIATFEAVANCFNVD